jgi:RNA polymerase primary sigma factor
MHQLALDKVTDGGCIKELMKKGRNAGFIEIGDLLKCIPKEITDSDQIEDIVALIEDMGITVKR